MDSLIYFFGADLVTGVEPALGGGGGDLGVLDSFLFSFEFDIVTSNKSLERVSRVKLENRLTR